MMFEVHPDNAGKWILYETGDGGFDVIAWFTNKEDAEFVCKAFEKRHEARTNETVPHLR